MSAARLDGWFRSRLGDAFWRIAGPDAVLTVRGPNHPAGSHAGRCAVLQRDLSVDHHRIDPRRVLVRLRESSRVLDRVGVEHHEIGETSRRHTPAPS